MHRRPRGPGPSETLVTGTINWTEHRLRLVQGGQAAFIEVPSQSGEPGFILILPISFKFDVTVTVN